MIIINYYLPVVGCGRRSRTLISAFRAQRVASYTIPQIEFYFEFLRLKISELRSHLAPGEGVEPSSLDSKSNVLPSYTIPEYVTCVQSSLKETKQFGEQGCW